MVQKRLDEMTSSELVERVRQIALKLTDSDDTITLGYAMGKIMKHEDEARRWRTFMRWIQDNVDSPAEEFVPAWAAAKGLEQHNAVIDDVYKAYKAKGIEP